MTTQEINSVVEKLRAVQVKVLNRKDLTELEEKLYYLDTHYTRRDAAKKAIKQNLA